VLHPLLAERLLLALTSPFLFIDAEACRTGNYQKPILIAPFAS